MTHSASPGRRPTSGLDGGSHTSAEQHCSEELQRCSISWGNTAVAEQAQSSVTSLKNTQDSVLATEHKLNTCKCMSGTSVATVRHLADAAKHNDLSQ